MEDLREAKFSLVRFERLGSANMKNKQFTTRMDKLIDRESRISLEAICDSNNRVELHDSAFCDDSVEGGVKIYKIVHLNHFDHDLECPCPRRMYVSVEVKDMYYQEKPVKAIFLRDQTQYVYKRVLISKKEEDRIAQMQNLTSTVSHEMRAPLGITQQYIELISRLKFKAENKKKFKHFLKLVMFQIVLMFGFVNDLLDLKTINEGIFEQRITVFDPKQVFKFIV